MEDSLGAGKMRRRRPRCVGTFRARSSYALAACAGVQLGRWLRAQRRSRLRAVQVENVGPHFKSDPLVFAWDEV
jgi:hypothetical protein